MKRVSMVLIVGAAVCAMAGCSGAKSTPEDSAESTTPNQSSALIPNSEKDQMYSLNTDQWPESDAADNRYSKRLQLLESEEQSVVLDISPIDVKAPLASETPASYQEDHQDLDDNQTASRVFRALGRALPRALEAMAEESMKRAHAKEQGEEKEPPHDE